jgi:hypothetical protein
MTGVLSKSGGSASLAEEEVSLGGQGVHREVESEGLAENYRALIEDESPG